MIDVTTQHLGIFSIHQILISFSLNYLHSLISLLTRYHAADAALGVGHVALVSWDQVHVAMEHRLAGGLVDVDAHVVAIGMETFVNLLLYVLQHDVHCFSLVVSKVKVISDMAFGNNQGITWRDRIAIIKSNTSGCFADDFHSSR